MVTCCIRSRSIYFPSYLVVSSSRQAAKLIDLQKTPADTWWNYSEKDPSAGKLESTHPSRTSVRSTKFFYGGEPVNDLTTDLIMANNNRHNNIWSKVNFGMGCCYSHFSPCSFQYCPITLKSSSSRTKSAGLLLKSDVALWSGGPGKRRDDWHHLASCRSLYIRETYILLGSSLVEPGVHNIRILVERGLSVISWLGVFSRNCLLAEDDHLAPHSFRDS